MNKTSDNQIITAAIEGQSGATIHSRIASIRAKIEEIENQYTILCRFHSYSVTNPSRNEPIVLGILRRERKVLLLEEKKLMAGKYVRLEDMIKIIDSIMKEVTAC